MVRFKNRYFLVELRFQDDLKHKGLSSITPKSLAHDVRQAMKAFFGDYGLATVQNSLSVKYLNVMTQRAIIRCCRAQHQFIRSVLTMMSSVNGTRCAIHVLHVSGTIRSSQKYLIKDNQRIIEDLIRHAKTADERAELHQAYKKTVKLKP